jgi:hypothetical protein
MSMGDSRFHLVVKHVEQIVDHFCQPRVPQLISEQAPEALKITSFWCRQNNTVLVRFCLKLRVLRVRSGNTARFLQSVLSNGLMQGLA